MRRNATHTIGLILPNISNPFYSELAHDVESVAQEHNCLVTYGNTNYHAQLTARYLEAFADRRVDGVIVAACTDEDMEVLQGYDAPIVVVDAHTAAATSGFPLVEVENVPAARELVAHLIRLGHRRIGDNHDRLTRNGVGPAERALAARPDKAPRRPRLT
jgi:LacI family transcriptional regulator